MPAPRPVDQVRRTTPRWALGRAGSPISQRLRTGSAGGRRPSLAEGLTLLRLAGRQAVPAPFAETLLGRALVAEAGLPETLEGMMTIAAPAVQGDGYAPVPFAPWACWVLLAQRGPNGSVSFQCLPQRPYLSEPRKGLTGEPESLPLGSASQAPSFTSSRRRAWPSSRVCWR